MLRHSRLEFAIVRRFFPIFWHERFRRLLCVSLIMFMFSVSFYSCNRSNGINDDIRDAEAKLGLGRANVAIEAYESILKKYPKDSHCPDIMYKIAEIYEKVLHNKSAALMKYKSVINAYPITEYSRKARERIAYICTNSNRIDCSIEQYEALIKFFPAYAEFYRTLLAGSYMASKKYAQAREELKPILGMNAVPADVMAQAVFAYAESLFLEGQLAEASRWYKVFLSHFPKSKLAGEVKLHLATCLEDAGKFGSARRMMKSASSEYPNKAVIETRINGLEKKGSERGEVIQNEDDSGKKQK